MSWLKRAFNDVKSAGLEVIEAVGENALTGVVGGIKQASPDAQKNVPDIGEDGRGGSIASPPLGALPQTAALTLQGLPTWAIVLGSVSSVALLGSTIYLIARP